jgi:hypothetical protein
LHWIPAYTVFFVLGQVMAMQVPFVGFQPVRTSEHMAAAGTFGLLQAAALFRYFQVSSLPPIVDRELPLCRIAYRENTHSRCSSAS